MRVRVFAIAVLLIAGSTLSNCGGHTSLPQSQSDNQLPANFSLVTDIPIPQNASMDNERSLVLPDHDRWTGRVVMRLWQSVGELTAFYQTQMPAYGWEPVMSAISDTSVLNYTRSDRAAMVQVEKSMLGLNSMVTITVASRQGGSASSGSSSYGSSGSTYSPVKTETLNSPNRR